MPMYLDEIVPHGTLRGGRDRPHTAYEQLQVESNDLASPSWSLPPCQQTVADAEIYAWVEPLLSALSSTLLNTPVSALDRQINNGLRRLVEACACDGGSLAEWSQELTAWRVKYWWGMPG